MSQNIPSLGTSLDTAEGNLNVYILLLEYVILIRYFNILKPLESATQATFAQP